MSENETTNQTLDSIQNVTTPENLETSEKPAKKKKSVILDAMQAYTPAVVHEDGYNPNAVENRFRPSCIEHHDYLQTRVRRWEVYQADTIRSGLSKIGIVKMADLDKAAGDERKMNVLSQFLTTCLVFPFKQKGVAKLFRKGTPGLARLKKDLRDKEVINALKACCELSRVFKE